MRRAEMRGAKGKASVFIAGVLASLAITAAASWIVAGQVAPATYLASTKISLDPRDANPTPDQIEGWRSFMAGLTTDPRRRQA